MLGECLESLFSAKREGVWWRVTCVNGKKQRRRGRCCAEEVSNGGLRWNWVWEEAGFGRGVGVGLKQMRRLGEGKDGCGGVVRGGGRAG